jgi:hypothetical protein
MWWERLQLPRPIARRLLRRKTTTNRRVTVSRGSFSRRTPQMIPMDHPERVAAPCQAGREALRNCGRAAGSPAFGSLPADFTCLGREPLPESGAELWPARSNLLLSTTQKRRSKIAGSLSVSPAMGDGCAAIDWSNPLTSASGVAILYAIEPAYLGCDALPGVSRLNSNIARPAPQCGTIRDVVTHLPERSDWPR